MKTLREAEEASATGTLPPEIAKVYEELIQAISKEIHDFQQRIVALYQDLKAQQQAAPQSAAAPASAPSSTMPFQRQGSLPWFSHGLRGFLNKLWYGNHPDNPMWTHECISLGDFATIQEGIEEHIELLLAEVDAAVAPELLAPFQAFRNRIASLIFKALEKAQQIAKAEKPEGEGPAGATAAASPDPKAPEAGDPVDAPAGEPSVPTDRHALENPDREWLDKLMNNNISRDELVARSNNWWAAIKKEYPEIAATKEDKKIRDLFLPASRTHGIATSDRIRQKAREDENYLPMAVAKKFMEGHGLNPDWPHHVLLVWPRHRITNLNGDHVGLDAIYPPVKVPPPAKGPTSAPAKSPAKKPADVTRGMARAMESNQFVRDLLKDEPTEVWAEYYKNLLKAGITA